MEIVDAVATGVDEHDHEEGLDEEAHIGRQLGDVVDGAHIEQYQHGKHDGKQSAAVVKETADAERYQDAEHDGDTAQHGDGHSLEFAGIGVVNYVFQQGYAQHLGVDPDGCEQRYHEGYEDVKNNGHIS